MAFSIASRVSAGSLSRAASTLASPSLGSAPTEASVVAVLREDVGEELLHDVAEDDRVGDLHHRGLEVHGEQHALRLGVGDLLGEEGVERRLAHHRGVDDLAGEHGQPVLEHGARAVGRDVLDPQRRRLRDRDRRLRVPEVAVGHRRDVRLRVGRPRAHRVRVLAGVALHRRGRAAVGVALAQHRVDGTALDRVVRRTRLLLVVGLRRLRVVGYGEARGLQLGDRGLQLRDRRADVGQLDDVGLGRLRERAELGERVRARGRTPPGCGRPARCRGSRCRRPPCRRTP